MTHISLDEQILLTACATSSISLRTRYCPLCHQMQFRGDALYIEVKCRRCKSLVIFQGEIVRSYNVQPY